MTLSSMWVAQRAAADHLGISERTLLRWRSAELLRPGVHFRRKFPNPNSPLLYRLDLVEEQMNAAFIRDHRSLELSNSSDETL